MIDVKLGEFINSLPNPTTFTNLFQRENEGIYHFGSKRIFIKLEQEKLIGNII